jgi:hypothetical protein
VVGVGRRTAYRMRMQEIGNVEVESVEDESVDNESESGWGSGQSQHTG